MRTSEFIGRRKWLSIPLSYWNITSVLQGPWKKFLSGKCPLLTGVILSVQVSLLSEMLIGRDSPTSTKIIGMWKLPNKWHCLGFFRELIKYLESITHPTFLLNQQKYCICSKALYLVSTYLKYRSQHVEIAGCLSNIRPVKLGVPSGCTPGTICFRSIYQCPFGSGRRDKGI